MPLDELQPQPFSIRVLRRHGRVVHMQAAGAVDLGTAAELERSLAQELQAGGQVRLDLSGVWFIDSVGVQALARAAHRAQSSVGGLILESPLPEQARRIIEITRLQNLLRID